MKYLFLIHSDGSQYASLDEAERKSIVAEFTALAETPRAS